MEMTANFQDRDTTGGPRGSKDDGKRRKVRFVQRMMERFESADADKDGQVTFTGSMKFVTTVPSNY